MTDKLILESRKVGRPAMNEPSALAATLRPSVRVAIRRYLADTRAGLVHDLGPTEADLTAAQVILIDRMMNCLALLRMFEADVVSHGLWSGKELAPALRGPYMQLTNVVRQTLQALGLKTRKADEVIKPMKWSEIYEKKG